MGEHFDLVVIGSGPGGYVAAIKASQLGKKTALIENRELGGTCLNRGCIPTKTLMHSSRLFYEAKNLQEAGIEIDGLRFDMNKIQERKEDVVIRIRKGIKGLLESNKVTIILGTATIMDNQRVLIKQASSIGNNTNQEVRELSADNILIATGSKPYLPPIEGIDQENVVTSDQLLMTREFMYHKLLIIGGGVIGIEFATIFSHLNVEVTIVEKMDNILINIDDEVRKTYLRLLKKDNVNIITSAVVTKVSDNIVFYEKDGKELSIKTEKILMSVGMRPNIPDLKSLNVEATKAGIMVNEKMETNVKGIYAIGDVNGRVMLAHAASAQGIVAVENIMGHNSKINFNHIPSGIYGFPEIAMVGLTEQTAKEKNIDYLISKFPLAGNGKALAEGETDGFIKIIAGKKYGEIIGVHILAPNATEMISEAVITMELEGTAYEVAKAIHPHPTLSEAIMESAQGIIGKPIHRL